MNKKQILDFAFDEAIKTVSLTTMEVEGVAEEVIATAMKGYADRNGYEFTDEEIHATIVAGIDTLNKAGADFKLQTWTMK